MYGVGLADNLKVDNWRVMFLICGGGTLVAGALFIWLMPQGPDTAWFLNEEERRVASARLRKDKLSKDGKDFKMSQFTEALLDPKMWALILMGFFGTMASPVLKVRIPVHIKTYISNGYSLHPSSSMALVSQSLTLCLSGFPPEFYRSSLSGYQSLG